MSFLFFSYVGLTGSGGKLLAVQVAGNKDGGTEARALSRAAVLAALRVSTKVSSFLHVCGRLASPSSLAAAFQASRLAH